MTTRTETAPVAHLHRASRPPTPSLRALFAANRWRFCGTIIRVAAAGLFVVYAAGPRF